MKYAVLMYADPDQTRAMSDAEIADIVRKHERLGGPLLESGELTGGAGLALPDETTVLRLGQEGVVASSGPLIDTSTEHLTAYYEIECETAERAREIAEQVLDHHVTAVELRRIHDTAAARLDADRPKH